MKTCDKCYFFKFHEGFVGGHCLRYPPQLVVIPGFDPAHTSIEQHYPYMDPTDMCGEFKDQPA